MGLEIIEELKKKKNLTSKELSEMSGVPLGTLNKILNRTTKDPKLETLKALSKVLGCTLDDFDDDIEIKDKKETTLISNFNKLNETGKDEAIKRVSELTEINKYTQEENEIYTLAAHDDGLSPEKSKERLNKAKEIFKEMDEE
ncbi:helix-turn-helix protein [Clostridium liquoris]|jgi:transcriptional regulator with XRE-family HTH domain|uniref:Helix-turn-helix protein n=1 Tax=Clostridium liquoris TaxID=1289519 RepID=A0A2T0B1G9_9CLOT|nr:helix-turn-helix transcriptional regulator [Clostridium liquoris]PRR77647.1 helix-turn-helix protein [Clostridium liquoris]